MLVRMFWMLIIQVSLQSFPYLHKFIFQLLITRSCHDRLSWKILLLVTYIRQITPSVFEGTPMTHELFTDSSP